MKQILFRDIPEFLVKRITNLCCGFLPQPVILCELQPGPTSVRLHQNLYLWLSWSALSEAKLRRKKPTIRKALCFPWHCRRSSRKLNGPCPASQRDFLANKETSLTVTKHLPCVLLLNNREIANPSEEKGKPRAYSSSPQHQYFC